MIQPEKADGFSPDVHATKTTEGEIKSFCIPVKMVIESPFLLLFLSSPTHNHSPEIYNEKKRGLTVKDKHDYIRIVTGGNKNVYQCYCFVGFTLHYAK